MAERFGLKSHQYKAEKLKLLSTAIDPV